MILVLRIGRVVYNCQIIARIFYISKIEITTKIKTKMRKLEQPSNTLNSVVKGAETRSQKLHKMNLAPPDVVVRTATESPCFVFNLTNVPLLSFSPFQSLLPPSPTAQVLLRIR